MEEEGKREREEREVDKEGERGLEKKGKERREGERRLEGERGG